MANINLENSQHSKTDYTPLLDIEENEFSVLDEAILDTASPQMSPANKMRRDSYSGNAFSPSEGAWSGFHFSIENGAVDQSAASQPFLQPPNGLPHGTSSHSAAALSQTAWPLNRPSGSCTPTPGFEQLMDFGGKRPPSFGRHAGQASQSATYDRFVPATGSGYQSTMAFPTSPQSSKGGWVSGSSPEGLDFRAMPTIDGPHSPTFAGSTHMLRRDGIRKKNARFEIPAERNLRTIDQLINQTNDEHEIKELKQQKRLLRNRQAALDSRQRKKQHTERLEEEKKQYTSLISELEDALNETRAQEIAWTREKESWALSQQQYQRYIESMVMEKEELVRRHTIETGELRKKNALFMEQMQRMDSTAVSTAPSSNGFSADFSDFDHLTMNSWDEFSVPQEFSIEADQRVNAPNPDANKQELARDIAIGSSSGEKAVSSGFLLMLLLCGAWVTSRSSSSATDLLPTIPDELRTASANVLDNIYRDSGIQIEDSSATAQPGPVSTMHDVAPQASKTTLSAFEFASISQSPLGNLHHRLVTPSEQQVRDQVFSLTPDQYNDLSSTSGFPNSTPRDNHRSIGEILATARVTGEGAAETYTQSLMKDRVSSQVLRDFARMVSQSNRVHEGQWKSEPVD